MPVYVLALFFVQTSLHHYPLYKGEIMYNFLTIASAVPKLFLADPAKNEKEILTLIQSAKEKDVDVFITPELSLTGATCGDLFTQPTLIDRAKHALENILYFTRDLDMLIFVGLPLNILGNLYNAMVAIHMGKIVAVVPKSPNPRESRWFSVPTTGTMSILDSDPLVSDNLIFSVNNTRLQIKMRNNSVQSSVIIDPWLMTSDITKDRLAIHKYLSIDSKIAYVKTAPGIMESTTDATYAGTSHIIENGVVLAQAESFQTESTLIYTQIDTDLLKSYQSSPDSWLVEILTKNQVPKTIIRPIDRFPYVPKDEAALEKALKIQYMSLVRRLLHTQVDTAVLAISGGVDSTLSLMATVSAFDFLGKDRKNIIAITMPGFGTSGTTYKNATALIKACGVTFREISIVPAVKAHLGDLKHNGNPDLAYENAQARERTQILMDIANMENGLVIGTGGMSEIALGFATYNGDHMSMYNVNGGVPKTLIRKLLAYKASQVPELHDVLHAILETPISPELLPTVDGQISQKTEEILGSYTITDFFLFHMLNNESPRKILFLAAHAFPEFEVDKLKQHLKSFYKRFFAAQYKRSCSVDGPQILDKSLSPRGGYVMPSDVMANNWINSLDEEEPEDVAF